MRDSQLRHSLLCGDFYPPQPLKIHSELERQRISLFWQDVGGTPANNTTEYYSTLLKENRYGTRGRCDYDSSEASFFIELKLFSRFFVPPSSPLNAS